MLTCQTNLNVDFGAFMQGGDHRREFDTLGPRADDNENARLHDLRLSRRWM